MPKPTEDQRPVTDTEAVANMAMAAVNRVPVEVLDLDGRTVVFTTVKDSCGGETVAMLVQQPRDDHGNLKNKPERIAGGVTVETQDSLVDYVRDFKGTGTRLFASIAHNVIVAVLDYHEGRTDAVHDMGGKVDPAKVGHAFVPAPDHGQHVATLQLVFSEQWTTWTGKDGKLMDQVEFARFVQENAPDVESPDGATLLELVRDLRGSRLHKFTGDVNLNAARDSFTYEDRATVGRAAGTLDVPDAFTLRLPVYFGGEAVAVQAQLRHDVNESGKLSLGFKLLRRESVRQATFRQLVDDVAGQAGVPAVYGTLKGPADLRPY